MKKVFTFGLLALMIFAGFMLTSCESLSSYKREAKEEINSYANFEEYSSNNWDIVLNIISDGEIAIDVATKKSIVDSIVINTKSDIDDIPKENFGVFCDLEDAYSNGTLTIQDLMSIAYYHGSLKGVNGEFIPTPKNPEILSVDIVEQICHDFFNTYVASQVDEYDIVTIDDVEISFYYGTYGDAVAILMKDNFGSVGVIREVMIDGITFEYNSLNNIIFWKTK